MVGPVHWRADARLHRNGRMQAVCRGGVKSSMSRSDGRLEFTGFELRLRNSEQCRRVQVPFAGGVLEPDVLESGLLLFRKGIVKDWGRRQGRMYKLFPGRRRS